jgi:hypothetical protein
VSQNEKRYLGIRLRFWIGYAIGVMFTAYSMVGAAAGGTDLATVIIGGVLFMVFGTMGAFAASWLLDRRQ